MPSNPLTLGYSPCPNDTFIFYALVHRMINTSDLRFNEMLLDVETLNQKALNSELDITKVSFHALGHLRNNYCLLHSGAAIGKGCGPVLVAKEDYDIKDLKGKTIAIPGKLTTAFLLLQIFDASLKVNAKAMPFNKIMDAVRTGEADAGLIIHESRFTYNNFGLRQVMDLGEWWEKRTGLPIPLGAIIAKRELGIDLISKIDLLLRNSIEFAFSNSKKTKSYIKEHAQEVSDDVIEQHIKLYVNNYSLDIGEDGVRAVKELYRMAEQRGIIEKTSRSLFAA